ncbi:TFIIB-type zinc ribbon-containing protein [[Eubacterium] cellulosolvens]
MRCPKCGKNTLILDHMDEYFKCKNCGYKETHETG